MIAFTRFVLRHKKSVVLIWLLLAIAGGATATITTSRLNKTFVLPNAQAFKSDAKVMSLYGGQGDPLVPVITSPSGETVASGPGRKVIQAATEAASLGGRYRVVSYTTTANRHFLARDGHLTYLLVFTPPIGFGSTDPTPAISKAVTAALPPSWAVHVTGTTALQSGGSSAKGNGVLVESIIGGAGALAILAVVFASALAILPIIIAAVSIPTTFLGLLGLTTITSISFVVQFLIALVGLGVAIDYALLITTRWREESAAHEGDEAVVRAMATAGRSVIFSGGTVAIGLFALVLLPVPFLRSMGFGGVLIPVISCLAALTLLPVCLGSIGPRLDRHRLRKADSASRPWTAWARLVGRFPAPAAALGAIVLIALLLPLSRLSIGQQTSTSLSSSGSAYVGLTELTSSGVPVGVLNPLQILSSGTSPQSEALVTQLRALPGVWSVIGPGSTTQIRGGLSDITVLPERGAGQTGANSTVNTILNFTKSQTKVVAVSGTIVDTIAFDNAIYGHFALLLVLVSVLSFLVLIRAFRSPLLAFKAVILNLLSLGSAYGVLVLIWQDGHGSQLLFGRSPTGSITNWVPIVIFAFLYGLAIDYEVFILTRMRESWDENHDTQLAIIDGIGRTGRLVTSAALILSFAFVALGTAPLTFLKVLATGLASGILIDAIVVRSLLVPALVALFGRWNWVLPSSVAKVFLIKERPSATEQAS